MKNVISTCTGFIVISLAIIILTSCRYEQVKPAEYPGQMIYMPAATYGIYDVAEEDTDTYSVPTSGYPYRFKVDSAEGKFIVPLAVYRSGVNNNGSFAVGIKINTDTVNQLVSSGALAGSLVLPTDKYSLPSSVNMKDGEELSTFELNIDLGFLRNNPDTIFAIGISISSTQRKTNPKFGTTIVIIDTKKIIL